MVLHGFVTGFNFYARKDQGWLRHIEMDLKVPVGHIILSHEEVDD
jgi:hypothetical protein